MIPGHGIRDLVPSPPAGGTVHTLRGAPVDEEALCEKAQAVVEEACQEFRMGSG